MQTASSWALQDAKNKFSAVIDAAQAGHAQIVTRRGIPTAVVLSIQEFEQFQKFKASQIPSFTELLLNMPKDDVEFERMDISLRDFE